MPIAYSFFLKFNETARMITNVHTGTGQTTNRTESVCSTNIPVILLDSTTTKSFRLYHGGGCGGFAKQTLWYANRNSSLPAKSLCWNYNDNNIKQSCVMKVGSRIGLEKQINLYNIRWLVLCCITQPNNMPWLFFIHHKGLQTVTRLKIKFVRTFFHHLTMMDCFTIEKFRFLTTWALFFKVSSTFRPLRFPTVFR